MLLKLRSDTLFMFQQKIVFLTSTFKKFIYYLKQKHQIKNPIFNILRRDYFLLYKKTFFCVNILKTLSLVTITA